MNALPENGFATLPIRWGQQTAERDGYSDYMGSWHYKVPLDEHGVGLALKGLVTLETTRRYREDVDAAIRRIWPCLVRAVAGEDTRRLYVFRCMPGGADEAIYTPNAHVTVRRRGLVVLSGTAEDGRAYGRDRDVLTFRAGELASFESHDGWRPQRELESLPPTDYSKVSDAPLQKRARKA